MRFLKLFSALIIACSLALAGCGEDATEHAYKESSKISKETLAKVGGELGQIADTANQLKEENRALKAAVSDLTERLIVSNVRLEELTKKIQGAQEDIKKSNQSLSAVDKALQEAGSWGWITWLLVIIVVVVVLWWLASKFLGGRDEFEDEDDLGDDFEGDDDLGLEDDLEDSLEDDKPEGGEEKK